MGPAQQGQHGQGYSASTPLCGCVVFVWPELVLPQGQPMSSRSITGCMLYISLQAPACSQLTLLGTAAYTPYSQVSVGKLVPT